MSKYLHQRLHLYRIVGKIGFYAIDKQLWDVMDRGILTEVYSGSAGSINGRNEVDKEEL
jgi:hypothetical protein